MPQPNHQRAQPLPYGAPPPRRRRWLALALIAVGVVAALVVLPLIIAAILRVPQLREERRMHEVQVEELEADKRAIDKMIQKTEAATGATTQKVGPP
jgi:hypothetical protein